MSRRETHIRIAESRDFNRFDTSVEAVMDKINAEGCYPGMSADRKKSISGTISYACVLFAGDCDSHPAEMSEISDNYIATLKDKYEELYEMNDDEDSKTLFEDHGFDYNAEAMKNLDSTSIRKIYLVVLENFLRDNV